MVIERGHTFRVMVGTWHRDVGVKGVCGRGYYGLPLVEHCGPPRGLLLWGTWAVYQAALGVQGVESNGGEHV